MGIFVSILALSFLIFFHELGHFIVAKIFGVGVQTFSIGFGPKILTFRYKGTNYCISAFLLGGYVKMQGEIIKGKTLYDDVDNASLHNKHPLVRMLIFFAGPLFNILLAFIIYLCVLVSVGVSMPTNEAIVGNVNKGFASFSPLKQRDKILSINGMDIKQFSDIRLAINMHNEKIANITLLRDNETLNLRVPLSEYNGSLVLGISPLMQQIKIDFIESLRLALLNTWVSIAFIYDGIVRLLTGLIGIENLSGIIGMTDVSANAYKSDHSHFALIIALISINLGVINLLPLPMLDGGGIVFSAYEWITKRRVDIRAANILSIIGFSLIITLMCVGAFNDISRIVNRA